MRWLIVLSVLVGGCSQAYQGIGLTTGSILPAKPAAADIAAAADTGTAAGRGAQAAPPMIRPVQTAELPPIPVSAPTSAAVTAASPIVRSGKVGGAERISGNMFRVITDDVRIGDRIERENYTLLRAAETTLAQGGTHFVLVNAGDQGALGLPSMTSLFTANKDAEYGAYFRILKIEPDTNAPIGTMSAEEIIHFFGPRFGRAPT